MKRQLFNVLHSVSAGEEVREGVVRLQDYARKGTVARRLHVLVADDNPTNREVIGKILERGGHAAVVVENGEEALDAIERESFDVVLLDRNMPGMGGMEALHAMRLMTRARGRLPIAMLSADVTPEVKREALEAGFDAFLPKPIEALRLLEEVQALSALKPEEPRRAEGQSPRAPRQAPGAVAVVNAETLGHLEELTSTNPFEGFEKLVGVFLADSATLLQRIEQALNARNLQEFRSLLHAMKGSSASMGTDRLTALCGDLGRLSDSELRLKASGLLHSIGEEFSAARGELERYLRERKRSTG